MKKITFLFIVFTQILLGQNNISLDYYLPQNISFNQEIPTPKEIIGHEVGEWHVTHDKLVEYMKKIAEVSPRVSIENRGETYEGRPIILLTITAPENHSNITEIRKSHVQLTENSGNSLNTENMPIVVYQGFSIHGNEPSGSNAALATIYYLAAAEGNKINDLLKNTVILLDPSLNPDGLQRFAYWANTNRSHVLNPDQNDREYDEVWPGGRTNHYWFDLNRDWLPIQLPESKARIETFHQWMPNILTDHHEMGTNSTFFFQPGEPSRVNPLTPKMNQQLTKEIAKYHAKALDKIGSLYYSEEDYDDFYYGKGSTFPDINGSIGILFEQGSSRGHIQESENGILTFPFTIRNQFTTALSTLEAAKNLRVDILNYQREFYTNARKEAAKSKSSAYIFGDEKDAAKTYQLAKILESQKIELYQANEDITINEKTFKKGYSYLVPKNQKNHRLIEAMFDIRTEFEDSLFYDISAWTFPYAFNLDFEETKTAGNRTNNITLRTGNVNEQSNYAYLFDWHEYYTPKALNMILNKGLRAKVGKTPFSLEGKDYDYGTIMIPVQNQKLNKSELYEFLQKVAKEAHIEITSVATGLTKGIDLGSNDFEALKKQKVALIVGNGITSYDAGEIWHLFDQRYNMQITKLDTDNLGRTSLDKYTTIILPNMWGSALNGTATQKIKDWVRNGGTLIGYRNAVNWLERNDLLKVEFKKNEMTAKNITFEQKQFFSGAQVTGGAIFKANLDRSHPINFGYKNETLPVFRNTNIYMEPNEESYNNPIQYDLNPLLSGYISEENLELLKGAVPFKVQRNGSGRVIAFTDNTNFRAFWYGTNKLLMNAIFFSKVM
ncbi:M14 family metallopeptidase [Zhouia amylolytica]|uniref:M14 family metallopeptidase n=1 Tax=Zhouia amylolytica TaxID=376730 RepID=UPI0020CE7738|nr:M14 family metallopeptidase [Zhouia amylolytica]MCQ0110153.1 zinc carboxypeptidase [Zhouia amylolytica]